jgi:hypothetical protein
MRAVATVPAHSDDIRENHRAGALGAGDRARYIGVISSMASAHRLFEGGGVSMRLPTDVSEEPRPPHFQISVFADANSRSDKGAPAFPVRVSALSAASTLRRPRRAPAADPSISAWSGGRSDGVASGSRAGVAAISRGRREGSAVPAVHAVLVRLLAPGDLPSRRRRAVSPPRSDPVEMPRASLDREQVDGSLRCRLSWPRARNAEAHPAITLARTSIAH